MGVDCKQQDEKVSGSNFVDNWEVIFLSSIFFKIAI